MRIQLWGVRGSLPAPVSPAQTRLRLEEILMQFERMLKTQSDLSAKRFIDTLPPHLAGGYGGHTTCGEIQSGTTRLLIDAGSGLRAFSEYVEKYEPERNEFHIYFTHFHWDHLIGLPFFAPLYRKGATIHCYAVDDHLEESLLRLFSKPNFPVPFEAIQKQLKLHSLKPRQTSRIGDLEITPYLLDHPDPCWGVRIEAAGKSVAWAVDTEATRTSPEELGPDQALYKDADLLIFDAQYSFGEALEKINWGHSSGPTGLELALRENVRQALFVHHDPAASDETVRQAEEETQAYFEILLSKREAQGLKYPDFHWRFGREGDLIQL